MKPVQRLFDVSGNAFITNAVASILYLYSDSEVFVFVVVVQP